MLILALISLSTLKSIAPDLATQQFIFWLLAGTVFLISRKINFSYLSKFSWPLYLILIFLLILVFFVGHISRGSSRWFDLYFFRIQPSQLAIPFVGILLSNFLAERNIRKIKNLLLYLFLLAIPGILILIEPDLGSTLIYLLTLSTILFLSKLSGKIIFLFIFLAILLTGFSWQFLFHDYQKNRIYSFLDPQSTTNYNAQQAMIAVGAGGLWGKGLGRGTQSHLRFLPERQTDFIFASFAEEWGLIGSLILLSSYSAILIFLLSYALRIKDPAQHYFLLVTATAVTAQALVNIGMNIGILPITGVTLPLVSYGGSSLLSLALLLGLSANIIDHYQHDLTWEIGENLVE